MSAFNLPPGRRIGALKALAFEGQQQGAFDDAEAGLAWLAEQGAARRPHGDD